MKKWTSILLLLFVSIQLFGNPEDEVKAQFPGGNTALAKFLDNNLKYPEEAQKQKWAGTTLIGFTVNEDGSISNIRVVKSTKLVLDNEALRLVKTMPKWTPASQNGANKKEMVILPINFDLNKKNIMY